MVLSESQVDLICKKTNYEPLSQSNTSLIKTFEILYEQLKLKYQPRSIKTILIEQSLIISA